MLFPECVCYINPGARDFFSECCDSQISLIQSEIATPPFSQSLLSPVPIQLFWGAFPFIWKQHQIHPSQDSLFNDSPHTLPPQRRVGGGFTIQSYEIILQKNGRFILTTPMWCSQDHFGKATFTLSLRHCPAASSYFSWSSLHSSSGSPRLRQLSLSITSQH